MSTRSARLREQARAHLATSPPLTIRELAAVLGVTGTSAAPYVWHLLNCVWFERVPDTRPTRWRLSAAQRARFTLERETTAEAGKDAPAGGMRN